MNVHVKMINSFLTTKLSLCLKIPKNSQFTITVGPNCPAVSLVSLYRMHSVGNENEVQCTVYLYMRRHGEGQILNLRIRHSFVVTKRLEETWISQQFESDGVEQSRIKADNKGDTTTET
jgi:hypothetical protein